AVAGGAGVAAGGGATAHTPAPRPQSTATAAAATFQVVAVMALVTPSARWTTDGSTFGTTASRAANTLAARARPPTELPARTPKTTAVSPTPRRDNRRAST